MLPQIDTMIGFSVVMLLLSLLITILVQATVAALNLRGRNLRWGVTVILERALPGLDAGKAEAIAVKVLAHRTLNLGVKLKVTAIRSDELIRVLGLLAESDEALAAEVAKARAALARLDAAGPIEDLLKQTFPDQVDKIAAVMASARDKAQKEMGDLKAWYDTVMDRTSERFGKWTRWVTVLFAVLLSFGLPIDSIALFKRISTSADLRARLGYSADAATRLADDVGRAEGTGKHLAAEALDVIKQKHPEVQAPVDRELGTRAQGQRWIAVHVGPEGRAVFEEEYEVEYDRLLRPVAKELLSSAASVKAHLADTQLVLVPAVRPSLSRESVLGMLMSVLFLSLGAPFWYNLLQQLGNLRPMLAGKVDDTEAKKAAPRPPAPS